MEIASLSERKEFIPELAALHHAEWGHLNPSLTLEKRIAKITALSGETGIPSFFIAISDGKLAGSAALVKEDMDTRTDLLPWLAAVYVKNQYRHQGVATALIARCESEAIHQNFNTWYLYTESASGLYEKLGWCHAERCVHKDVMVSIMSKELSPS